MALIASPRERPFGSDELFVAATDRAGRLRSADELFTRLSGCVPGEPYDEFRHPEQPRAVLRELLGPAPAAGYVKHLAKDGAFFWAMVLAIPVADGHVLVGFQPAGEAFDAVRARYREIREAELGGEAPALPDLRGAFAAEEAARGEPALGALGALFDRLGSGLAAHAELAESLQRKSGFVEELAESIRLFALNAILAAHRLVNAAAIGEVARLLQTRSDEAAPEIRALATEIERTVTLLGAAAFHVAAGRLLTAVPPTEALAAITDAVCASVAAVDAALDRLADVAQAVEEHLKLIRFLELQGRIEAARANDT